MFRWMVRKIPKLNTRNVGNFKVKPILKLEKSFEEEFRDRVQNQKISREEWGDYKKKLLESHKFINNVNVDATILGLCNKYGGVDIGRTYIQYLNDQKQPLNAVVISKYMKLFAIPKGEKNLPLEQEKEITDLYNQIKTSSSTLAPSSLESIIYGVCLTREWKKALKLIENIKAMAVPSHVAYNSVIQAAFRNDDPELGTMFVEEAIVNDRFSSPFSLTTWIDFCQRNPKHLISFLKFLEDYELLITELVAAHLKESLEQQGIVVTLTDINRRGICNNCSTKIDEFSVSDEEFKKLRKEFLGKVLIKDNIFLKSNPKELTYYTEFLEENAPFDCVIDGLNVAFSTGSNKSPFNHSNQIIAVLKYFTEKKKKVLVLGRHHMRRWPGFVKRIEENNAHLFLTTDLSHDDPYLLYAALKSGPHCDVVSRDFMRSHAFLLGPELKTIFRKWQRIHQFSFTSPANTESTRTFIRPPVKYKISAHRNKGIFWHVPYKEEGQTITSSILDQPFEVPNRWLCFDLIK